MNNTNRKVPEDWSPAFGQISSSQRYLENQKVESGDLFLFFGKFHRVIEDNGKYRYTKKDDCKHYPNFTYYDYNDIHIIWGYMQVERVLKNKEEIEKYHWHPHSSKDRLKEKTNALYIPTKRLSFNNDLSGCGLLNYRADRVLTMVGKSMAQWISHDCLMPHNICSDRKNSSKDGALYYQGVWQELILKETSEAASWAERIINNI